MKEYQNITIYEYIQDLDRETVLDTPPAEQSVDEQGKIIPVPILETKEET